MLCPVHTAPFLYKNAEKNLHFVLNRSHYSAQKRTKTAVFENAADQCERTKTNRYKNTATATTLAQNKWLFVIVSMKAKSRKD